MMLVIPRGLYYYCHDSIGYFRLVIAILTMWMMIGMFTKNIVLEALRPYRGSHYLDMDINPEFRWISMLPGSPDEMEPSILYVCFLSAAMRCNLENPGYYYLCIRDRFSEDDEDAEALKGIFVINENHDTSWLYNVMQRRFIEISVWVKKMRIALIDYCDFQRLIDLSEPILNNFVAILDSSHKLVAFSKNTECHNLINVSLVEKGFHTDQVLKKLGETRRYEIYEQEQGVIISPPIESFANYEAVTKTFHYGGEWLFLVAMECSITPLSPCIIDLFEIFTENLYLCFINQQRTHQSQLFASTLMEMLYEGLNNTFIIGERAKTANIPFYGYFNAYRMVFDDNSATVTS